MRLLVELFFVRLGNFFNSEIIGKETNSTFGIKFIRDQFSPRDAVNAHKYQTQMRPKLLQTIHNLSIYWNKFRPDILLSCMRHFAMFLFFAILFSYTGKQTRQKSGFLFGLFCTIILRTYCCRICKVKVVLRAL
jgi:prolipoprotein diacylglyceryltransferase